MYRSLLRTVWRLTLILLLLSGCTPGSPGGSGGQPEPAGLVSITCKPEFELKEQQQVHVLDAEGRDRASFRQWLVLDDGARQFRIAWGSPPTSRGPVTLYAHQTYRFTLSTLITNGVPVHKVMRIEKDGEVIYETPQEGALSRPTDLKSRAEAVVTLDRNVRGWDASTAAIMNAFNLIAERELEPALLATYDTRTLEVLFEAVRIALDRSQRSDLLQALEDVFQECLRRGFVGNHLVNHLYARHIQYRDWEKARKLYDRFPSAGPELPDIVEPASPPDGVPAVYVVSEDGGTLTYAPVDLTGPVIVSVVSPGCHFSNDLVQRIETDPALVSLFRDHAVNIYPAFYSLRTAELARLNREGRFRYAVLHRATDWNGFDFSSTPQFYFVKGGKIVHHIRSVKPDELGVKLEAGLAAIGRDE